MDGREYQEIVTVRAHMRSCLHGNSSRCKITTLEGPPSPSQMPSAVYSLSELKLSLYTWNKSTLALAWQLGDGQRQQP